MEHRTLGKTGLEVPVVGMGTWQTFNVRGSAAQKNACIIVDTALKAGANFFDSSPMYGEAEHVLGECLQGRREQALVATKVWASTGSEGQAQVRRALQFFGGYIELYQIHNLVNWREHLVMLERLRDAGQVRAIGATHYSSSAFAELRQVMIGMLIEMQAPLFGGKFSEKCMRFVITFCASLEDLFQIAGGSLSFFMEIKAAGHFEIGRSGISFSERLR